MRRGRHRAHGFVRRLQRKLRRGGRHLQVDGTHSSLSRAATQRDPDGHAPPSSQLTALHHLNVWTIGILVGIHVAAVVGHLALVKENLLRPMVTGRKRLPPPLARHGIERMPHGRAVALLAACIFAVWWLVTRV